MIIGLAMLIIGANLLVEGSIKIAKKFKISTIIISMTIISIGTSMPEFAIACVSSSKGSQIALSNNIGSIISTIAISIGITSLLYTIHLKKNISREVVKMILIQMVLLLLLVIGDGLNIMDGIIFLGIFAFYMRHLIKKSKKIISERDEEKLIEEKENFIKEAGDIKQMSIFTACTFIVLGLILVIYGSNFVVDAATQIARYLSLSEAFIGVTVVALGTTLPELSTALVAGKKKEFDIIIGNVIGSGVSNIMLIVGVASIIHPIHYTNTLLFQIGFMILFGLIFYTLSTQEKIERDDGLVLLSMYIIFVTLSSII
jgi:cation:H+ antiporter